MDFTPNDQQNETNGIKYCRMSHTSLELRCINVSRSSIPCSTVVTVSKDEQITFCIITSKSLTLARNLKQLDVDVCNRKYDQYNSSHPLHIAFHQGNVEHSIRYEIKMSANRQL